MEERRNIFKILTDNLQKNTKSRHLCEGNIRMDLREIRINTRNWINSAQNRDYWRILVNAALNLQVS